MEARHLTLTLLAGALLATGPLLAADIYRYVDAEGNVNYVDRPSGAATEERVVIVSNRSGADRTPATASAAEPRDDGAAANDNTQAKKPTRAELRAQRLEREQQCQQYRDQMETLVSARRLYREDENGERVYLDETESQAARDRVQERIREFCR